MASVGSVGPHTVGTDAQKVEVVGLYLIARLAGNLGDHFTHGAVIQVGHSAAFTTNDAIVMLGVLVVGRGDDVVLASFGQVQAREDAQVLQELEGAKDRGTP